MHTLALIAFTVLDAWTDALLWPLFRRRKVDNLAYQAARFVVLRLPMLYIVLVWTGPLGVLLSLLLVWSAPMDTLYHVFGGEGKYGRRAIPLGTWAHDHKGPIIPSLAGRALGTSPISEREYRHASVAAGIAVLACALCVDLTLLLL